jgi:excisionase family DNA binding protein
VGLFINPVNLEGENTMSDPKLETRPRPDFPGIVWASHLPPGTIPTSEAADLLGVSDSTVYRMARDGRIPAGAQARRGRRVGFYPEQLDQVTQ